MYVNIERITVHIMMNSNNRPDLTFLAIENVWMHLDGFTVEFFELLADHTQIRDQPVQVTLIHNGTSYKKISQ